jgi:hypothetical protein
MRQLFLAVSGKPETYMNKEKLAESLKQIARLADDCLKELELGHSSPKPARRVPLPNKSLRTQQQVDFELPYRAFIDRHVRASASGPEKFTLVLAHITKGGASGGAQLEAVEKAWRKKKGRLGKFNLAYTTRAKDKGWVDSPKKGTYVLRQDWTEILHDDDK